MRVKSVITERKRSRLLKREHPYQATLSVLVTEDTSWSLHDTIIQALWYCFRKLLRLFGGCRKRLHLLSQLFFHLTAMKITFLVFALLRYPRHFQKDVIRGICCSAKISVWALKINAVEHMRSDILQTQESENLC